MVHSVSAGAHCGTPAGGHYRLLGWRGTAGLKQASHCPACAHQHAGMQSPLTRSGQHVKQPPRSHHRRWEVDTCKAAGTSAYGLCPALTVERDMQMLLGYTREPCANTSRRLGMGKLRWVLNDWQRLAAHDTRCTFQTSHPQARRPCFRCHAHMGRR